MIIRLAIYLCLTMVLALLVHTPTGVRPAFAQEITQEPICFNIINQAPYSVYGTFTTAYFTDTDGSQKRHDGSFRLQKSGTFHKDGYLIDRAEFCSSGPFFPGRTLELTLRTLIPLFSCKTRVDRGDIIIKGRRKTGGGTKTWAECFE